MKCGVTECLNDREKLDVIGQAGRAADPDVWLRNLTKTIVDPRDAGIPVVIDDCRFENEYWVLKALGFVSVRFLAPYDERVDRLKGTGKWVSHESMESPIQHSLDHMPTDHELWNDAGITELWDGVARILERERGRRG